MQKGMVWGIFWIFSVVALTGCGGGSGGATNPAPGNATPPTLNSLAVTPANPTTTIGAQQQFTATGTYSDNTIQDITGSVTWSSSDTNNATIAVTGLATAVSTGNTTIKAQSGVVAGSVVLAIVPPASNPNIALNKPVTADYTPGTGVPALITNGIFAPEGTSAADTNYAVRLDGKLTIDLGRLFTGLNRVKVQAENNDTYRVEYSADGTTWATFYDAPAVAGAGLRTRDSGIVAAISARYLRLSATGNDGSYSASELQVFALENIALNKPVTADYTPAFGTPSLLTNGVFAPEETNWETPNYAVQLGGKLTVDLGRVYSGIVYVKVQVDNNDNYRIESSADGASWAPFYDVPLSGNSGLNTRSSEISPPVSARYLRIYQTAGDGLYSVSELQVFTMKSDS